MFWLTLSLPSIIPFEIVPKINDRQLLHPKHILPMTNKIFQGSVLSQLLLQICTCNILKLRYVICRIAPYTLPDTEDSSEQPHRWGWIKTGRRSVERTREDRRNARYNTTHFKMLVSFPFWTLWSTLNPLNKNQAHNNCIPWLRALFAWDQTRHYPIMHSWHKTSDPSQVKVIKIRKYTKEL